MPPVKECGVQQVALPNIKKRQKKKIFCDQDDV